MSNSKKPSNEAPPHGGTNSRPHGGKHPLLDSKSAQHAACTGTRGAPDPWTRRNYQATHGHRGPRRRQRQQVLMTPAAPTSQANMTATRERARPAA